MVFIYFPLIDWVCNSGMDRNNNGKGNSFTQADCLPCRTAGFCSQATVNSNPERNILSIAIIISDLAFICTSFCSGFDFAAALVQSYPSTLLGILGPLIIQAANIDIGINGQDFRFTRNDFNSPAFCHNGKAGINMDVEPSRGFIAKIIPDRAIVLRIPVHFISVEYVLFSTGDWLIYYIRFTVFVDFFCLKIPLVMRIAGVDGSNNR